MDSRRTLHVVSHTHWDREWYFHFEYFRFRMVELIDGLMEILDEDDSFEYFYLDGQTVLLEDYAAVRPTKVGELLRFIKEDRVQIGPWYTATDENLVSGESLIRNLLIGLNMSYRYGSPAMVGYLPDQFGHVSQMPQILNGFGIKYAVIGRGLNRDQHNNEFYWESKEGSRVFGVFMNTWYNNACDIPLNPEAAADFLTKVGDDVERTSVTKHLLLMNGVDHIEPQPGLGHVLSKAASLMPDVLLHSTLEKALDAISTDVPRDLEIFPGELREDLGGRLDSGVISARMPLKLANFSVTSLIERVAEPLAAMCKVVTGKDLGDFLIHAWKTLLKNHPHDSICGCCIDPVANQIMSRFDSARETAKSIAESSVQALSSHVGYSGKKGEFMAYNPSSFDRNAAEIIEIDIPVGEPTRKPIDTQRKPYRFEAIPAVEVTDGDGKCLPVQLISIRETERLVTSATQLPKAQPVQRVKIAFQPKLGPFELANYRVSVQAAEKRMGKTEEDLVKSPTEIENEYLRLRLAENGSLWLMSKITGKEIGPIHIVEDGGDVGDAYHYVQPQMDSVITKASADQHSLIERGHLSAAFRLRYELMVPSKADAQRLGRDEKLIPLTIEVVARVKRGCPYLLFEATVDNTAKDHRLRVVFPSGIHSKVTTSSVQLDTATRQIAIPDAWVGAATTQPHTGWVDVSDGSSGMAVFSKGLPEAEALPTKDGIHLALTLLRSVGALSRRSATPLVIPTPDAQCLGEHIFEYAVYPHAGDWRCGNVWQAWSRYGNDLYTCQPTDMLEVDEEGQRSGSSKKVLPSLTPITVDGSDFVISIVKSPTPVRESDVVPFNIVVRGFGIASEESSFCMGSSFAIERAYVLNLAEDVIDTCQVQDNTVKLSVRPHEIITIGLQLGF